MRNSQSLPPRRAGLFLCVLFACCLPAGQALAARLTDLYQAEVPVEAAAAPESAFGTALAAVLVKLSGRRDVTVAGLGEPAALVAQYRRTAPDRVMVGFDAQALRQAMDRAGLPVWGEERPSILVWLAVDAGRGQRDILAAADSPAAGTPGGPADAAAARETLETVARERGLPLLLPLVDAEDLTGLSFADLWGDFTAPVLEASRRYRADAVLIGRARGYDAGTVRWSLLVNGERLDWSGSMADGPDGAADRLAARLAAGAGDRRALRLEVAGVQGLDAYARVTSYLAGLSLVDACEVLEVHGDRVLFGLQVRGDLDQLMRTIALQRLLQPAEPDAGAGTADIHYLFAGG